MRKKTVATVLATGLVAGGAALFAPGVASAADAGATPSASPSATDRAAARVTAIQDALKGLVGDGTITQSQADKVASTLASSGGGWRGGRGGPGGHGLGAGWAGPDQAASILGISTDQLRTALEGGQTLAQVAQAHGVSRADLVDKLVAAAKTQLAAAVKAGRITQAQSDEMSSDLATRIGDRVDRTRPARGDRGDRGGWGGGRGGSGSPSSTATPSASASA